MASLEALCNHPKFTSLQKEVFFKKRGELVSLANEENTKTVVLRLLRDVGERYDNGGHSISRSLRSSLLSSIIDSLEGGRNEKAKYGLSILLAMYFDYKYINSAKWFDGPPLLSIRDIPLEDRISLCASAILLGVDDIPDIAYWPREFIIAFVEG